MRTMVHSGNILIIGEWDEFLNLLRYNLKTEGYKVYVFRKISDISARDFSQMRIAIVNITHTDHWMLDELTRLTNSTEGAKVPVILCADKENRDMMLKSFDAGIDDYLTKPYSLREIIARIKAVLRRYPPEEPTYARHTDQGINFENLNMYVDTVNHKVTCGDSVLPLTKTEYFIFEFLIKNVNNFYTRDQIFHHIWKDSEKVNTRIVDTNISRLRKKLGDASRSIVNRYNLGYAFVDKE